MDYNEVILKVKDLNKKYNSLITICEKNDSEKEGKLSGVTFSCKDNILTKDIKTTCASKMLQDFVPFADAKVVELLKNEGAVLVGKANMDEFAFGSTGETSIFGRCINPKDENLTTGGSSSGSAVSVACSQADFSLGTDSGGSVRQPAAHCNIVGVKPSYELVSNEGVVSCVSSMDCVGVLAKDVKQSAKVLSIISQGKINSNIDESFDGIKIGVPKEYFDYQGIDDTMKEQTLKAIKALEDKGATVVPVSIPNFDSQMTVYNIIGTAEISSNFAKIDGVKYGFRAQGDSWEEIFLNSRSLGFGYETKKRIVKGTYFMSEEGYEEYLIPAQKMRTVLINQYNDALNMCDVLITPTTPTVSFKAGQARGDEDVFTVGASICGLPAISVPYGEIGVQVIAKRNDEANMFKAALALENVR